MTDPSPHDLTLDEVGAFIVALGTDAHAYGVSSVRLEVYLDRVVTALGLKGAFMVTPGYINFILWTPDDPTQHSRFVRMSGGGIEMDKLARLGALVDHIADGSVPLSDGVARLREIADRPPLYGTLTVGLGYALAGAGFAVLLAAAWGDVLLGGLLSLVVYALVLLSGRSTWLSHSLLLCSAFVAAVLANLLAVALPGSDAFFVTLCALVVLIPGLALTQGFAEISVHHVISGTHRLTDGILDTFRLFLGAAIGTALVSAVIAVPAPATPPAIAPLWTWIFVALLVAGLSLIFQISRRDIGWTLLGGLLAYGAMVAGGSLGFWQGAFLGAIALGAYANLYANRAGRPTSIILTTGIMILVPGVAAYRGLEAASLGGAASGLTAEWHVFINIFAILAGLLVANTLIKAKLIF